jgi:hypothetical protein
MEQYLLSADHQQDWNFIWAGFISLNRMCMSGSRNRFKTIKEVRNNNGR